MRNADGFLTVDEAAVLAGISHWTVRSWLNKGLLTRYKSAGRTVVSRPELLARLAPTAATGVQNAPDQVDLGVAIFAKEGSYHSLIDLVLLDLGADGESGAADVVARGYSYCGFMSVANGIAKVECEHGALATLAMVHAGILFVEKLALQMTEKK